MSSCVSHPTLKPTASCQVEKDITGSRVVRAIQELGFSHVIISSLLKLKYKKIVSRTLNILKTCIVLQEYCNREQHI